MFPPRQRPFALMLLILACHATPVWALSVNDAYRAIPHEQTTFSSAQAKMKLQEKAYLEKSFTLIDQAMAARVGAMLWAQSGGQRGESIEVYDQKVGRILQSLAALPVPANLKQYHQLIQSSIQEQKAYWDKFKPGGKMNLSDPLVQSSHGKILQAYNLLRRAYPQEAAHNQKAFFNHLCALDFI